MDEWFAIYAIEEEGGERTRTKLTTRPTQEEAEEAADKFRSKFFGVSVVVIKETVLWRSPNVQSTPERS